MKTRSLFLCVLVCLACTANTDSNRYESIEVEIGKADQEGGKFRWIGASMAQLIDSQIEPPANASEEEIENWNPDDVHWKDVDEDVKEELMRRAEELLKRYEQQWGKKLRAKEAILLHSPSEEMIANMNTFFRVTFPYFLSENFDVRTWPENKMTRQLKRLYLARIATYGAEMVHHHGMPAPPNAFEWDGVTRLNRFPQPNHETIDAQKTYAASILEALREIESNPSELTEDQTLLLRDAIHIARQLAAGSHVRAHGGDDLKTSVGILDSAFSLMEGYALRDRDGDGDIDPPVIATHNGMGSGDEFEFEYTDADEELFLATTNALMLGNLTATEPRPRLDKGVMVFIRDDAQPFINGESDETLGAENGARFRALLRWFVDRISATEEATRACTPYRNEEQDAIWEAFTADMTTENLAGTTTPPSPENGYRTLTALGKQVPSFEKWAQRVVGNYHGAWWDALRAFIVEQKEEIRADLTLSDEEKQIQLSELERKFDEVQEAVIRKGHIFGTNAIIFDAFPLMEERFDEVTVVGGYEDDETTMRSQDVEIVREVWYNYQDFLHENYAIELDEMNPIIELQPNTHVGWALPDRVIIGFRRGRPLGELYGLILHEGHHVISYERKLPRNGVADEGAATQVQNAMISDFLDYVLPRHGQNALSNKGFYMIGPFNWSGFVARTHMTLMRHIRGCGPHGYEPLGPDTILAGRAIFTDVWGIPPGPSDDDGNLIDERYWDVAIERSHENFRYYQYSFGWSEYDVILDTINEGWENPPTRNGEPIVLDGYHLLSCNMVVPDIRPERLEITRETLKSCVDAISQPRPALPPRGQRGLRIEFSGESDHHE